MENEEMRIARLKKEAREYRRNKNILKHLRIAEATIGHEREKHLALAKKLTEKYTALDEKEELKNN